MRCRRLLFLLVCCLSQWLTVSEATFERSTFPAPPLAAVFRPNLNPATLGGVSVPCGRIGHDRPFGLSELSSHAFVLATPLLNQPDVGLTIALGAASRGSGSLRENAVWIGTGTRLMRLKLGVARRWLWWQSAAGTGNRARGWRFGLELPLSDAWIVDGSVQPPTDISPGRADVRLTRRNQTGAVIGNVSSRQGRRRIPAVAVAAVMHKHLILAGQVQSLAHSFSVGGTVPGRVDLHARVDIHPVLGRSFGGALTRSCHR